MNPWALDAHQKRALLVCRDAVWAEEVLRDRGGRLTADSIRRLTLMATDDQTAADRAYADAVVREMDRKAGR